MRHEPWRTPPEHMVDAITLAVIGFICVGIILAGANYIVSRLAEVRSSMAELNVLFIVAMVIGLVAFNGTVVSINALRRYKKSNHPRLARLLSTTTLTLNLIPLVVFTVLILWRLLLLKGACPLKPLHPPLP